MELEEYNTYLKEKGVTAVAMTEYKFIATGRLNMSPDLLAFTLLLDALNDGHLPNEREAQYIYPCSVEKVLERGGNGLNNSPLLTDDEFLELNDKTQQLLDTQRCTVILEARVQSEPTILKRSAVCSDNVDRTFTPMLMVLAFANEGYDYMRFVTREDISMKESYKGAHVDEEETVH